MSAYDTIRAGDAEPFLFDYVSPLSEDTIHSAQVYVIGRAIEEEWDVEERNELLHLLGLKAHNLPANRREKHRQKGKSRARNARRKEAS